MKYSCFISYRRNEGDKKFIDKLKGILQNQAFAATDKKDVFFDTDSIRFGQDFSDKIYDGLENSWFFMAIWYYHYLSEDNLFCAKELNHALEIQKALKAIIPEEDRVNFNFVIPIVRKGSVNDLPDCLAKDLAIEISKYESAIYSTRKSKALIDLEHKIYNDLLSYYRTLIAHITNVDFKELFKSIEKLDDETIKNWIREQNRTITNNEAEKVPVLIKTNE